MASAAYASMVSSTMNAAIDVTNAAIRSSHTSRICAMSRASSRKRLTASPGEPGRRPVTGPGSRTSEMRMLTRGTVCQNTQAPCHCTMAPPRIIQRTICTEPSAISSTQTVLPVPPAATSSSTALARRPAGSGREKKAIHATREIDQVAGSSRRSWRAKARLRCAVGACSPSMAASSSSKSKPRRSRTASRRGSVAPTGVGRPSRRAEACGGSLGVAAGRVGGERRRGGRARRCGRGRARGSRRRRRAWRAGGR